MNTGDPCPKCTRSTWLYDPSTLTCKDGHRTNVATLVATAVRRPLEVAARRRVPAFAWALAGAAVDSLVHLAVGGVI